MGANIVKKQPLICLVFQQPTQTATGKSPSLVSLLLWCPDGNTKTQREGSHCRSRKHPGLLTSKHSALPATLSSSPTPEVPASRDFRGGQEGLLGLQLYDFLTASFLLPFPSSPSFSPTQKERTG